MVPAVGCLSLERCLIDVHHINSHVLLLIGYNPAPYRVASVLVVAVYFSFNLELFLAHLVSQALHGTLLC